MNHLSNGKIAIGTQGSKARLREYDEEVIPQDGDKTFVIFVANRNYRGFAIRFDCNGTDYFQPLILKCRGGNTRAYFEAARRLYGYLKRDGELSQADTFQKLAV